MKFLIDTNVISESVKTKPNSGVIEFLQAIESENLYISVLTIGELRKGVERLNNELSKKHKLHLWLEKDLTAFFSKRTIAIDQNVANKWGGLLASIKQPVPVIDSLIAATALCYNLTLVTRNIKDFSKFPLEVLNPWV